MHPLPPPYCFAIHYLAGGVRSLKIIRNNFPMNKNLSLSIIYVTKPKVCLALHKMHFGRLFLKEN